MYILTQFSPSMVYTSKHVYDNIYAVLNLSKNKFLKYGMLNRNLEQKCKEKCLTFEKCKIMIRQKESNICTLKIHVFEWIFAKIFIMSLMKHIDKKWEERGYIEI